MKFSIVILLNSLLSLPVKVTSNFFVRFSTAFSPPIFLIDN